MADQSIFEGRIPPCGTTCMAGVLEDALDCDRYTEQSCFCQPEALEALRDEERSAEGFECLYVDCDISGRRVGYSDVDAACNVFSLAELTTTTGQASTTVSTPTTTTTGRASTTEGTPTTTIMAPDPSFAPQPPSADETDTDNGGGISLGAKVAIPVGIVVAAAVLVAFFFRRYVRRWAGRVAGSRSKANIPELSGKGLTGHEFGPELAGSRPSGHAVGSELAGCRPSGYATGAAELGVGDPQMAELDGTGVGGTLPRRERGQTSPRPESWDSEGGAKVFKI